MINEAVLSKPITNIGSQEEFVKIIKKCLKNNIPVYFDMPFMTKADRKKNEEGPFGPAWRFRPNFNYQDYYHHNSRGKLDYIAANRYVCISPEGQDLISDERLDFATLYNELLRSPEDFKMFIDGKEINFSNGEFDEAFDWGTVEDPDAKNPELAKTCYDLIGEYLHSLDAFQIENNKETLAHEYNETIADAIFDHWSPEKLMANMDDTEVEELVKNPKGTIDRMASILHRLDMYNSKANGMMESAMRTVMEKESKGAKDFKEIEKKAEKEYGSKEAGKKVAGKVKAEIAKKKGIKEEDKDTKTSDESAVSPKEKFVIELTFPYDGDDDLANAVEEQLSKKAEVNEVVRTRRIMEFDYKNQAMFSAAMKTIQNIMNEKGKTDYKLDSRTEEDTGDSVEASSEEKSIEEGTYDDWKTMTPDEEDENKKKSEKDPDDERDEKMDESRSLQESINILAEADRFPITMTLPFIVESMKWVAKSNLSEAEVLKYVLSLAEATGGTGSTLDLG